MLQRIGVCVCVCLGGFHKLHLGFEFPDCLVVGRASACTCPLLLLLRNTTRKRVSHLGAERP